MKAFPSTIQEMRLPKYSWIICSRRYFGIWSMQAISINFTLRFSKIILCFFFLEVFGRSSLFWTPLYIGRLRYSYGLYEFGKPLMHVCFGCLQGRITLSKPLFSISTYFFHQKIVFYLSIFSFKISTDYQIIRQVWNSYKCLLKVKSNHTMYEYTNLILGGWVWRLVSTSQKKKRSMRAFGQISDNIFCIALLFYY